MRISVKMERTIKQLTEKHEVDLAQAEAYLHLHNQPYLPLAVYNRGLNSVRVMHINRDWQMDPEITFWTGSTAGWVATEITQLIGGQRSYVEFDDNGTEPVSMDESRQASLTNFAEMWAQNLVEQEWLTHSERSPEQFPLGNVVATPGALALLAEHKAAAQTFIERHVCGDWGMLDEFDWRQNEEALEVGDRLLSRYVLAPGAILWLITEWDRSATTLLLPAEY